MFPLCLKNLFFQLCGFQTQIQIWISIRLCVYISVFAFSLISVTSDCLPTDISIKKPLSLAGKIFNLWHLLLGLKVPPLLSTKAHNIQFLITKKRLGFGWLGLNNFVIRPNGPAQKHCKHVDFFSLHYFQKNAWFFHLTQLP